MDGWDGMGWDGMGWMDGQWMDPLIQLTSHYNPTPNIPHQLLPHLAVM